ncbi:hypothetical protein [Burkholderia glumae]|uniref:DUF1631 domain-containing protein n=1 Tax=Burkholderia glumae TaxID=337 RepID=A0ABY5BCA9_BURGL|nr:hypothetical protein [Burkholderia glumae]ACR28682.1 Hypothetical protein bglu_1g15410 [Burkholderia glumae BGR1]USS44642.1 hypothetical protein NFI99_23735 [Burkholderia glumae]
MNPFDTSALPPRAPDQQPRLIAGPRGITARQVEIMTATLCGAIADRKFACDRADEEIPALIGAMVKQVRHLNEAVAAPTEPEARMAIDRFGRPVLIESDAEGARPPLPAAAPAKRECGPQAGFAITRDWELLDLSSSMTGRRFLAVVLFGAEDFAAVERVMRARIVPMQGDPVLRDCLRDAVRKCRGNCHPPDARP